MRLESVRAHHFGCLACKPSADSPGERRMAPPSHCDRRRPEQTTLYRLVQQHAATFFEQAQAQAGTDQGSTYMADNDGESDEARMLRPLQAAACTCRIAFGPRAGQKELTVQGTMPRETDFKRTLCGAGQVVLKLKTPWRDGTTHLGLSRRHGSWG